MFVFSLLVEGIFQDCFPIRSVPKHYYEQNQNVFKLAELKKNLFVVKRLWCRSLRHKDFFISFFFDWCFGGRKMFVLL